MSRRGPAYLSVNQSGHTVYQPSFQPHQHICELVHTKVPHTASSYQKQKLQLPISHIEGKQEVACVLGDLVRSNIFACASLALSYGISRSRGDGYFGQIWVIIQNERTPTARWSCHQGVELLADQG